MKEKIKKIEFIGQGKDMLIGQLLPMKNQQDLTSDGENRKTKKKLIFHV